MSALTDGPEKEALQAELKAYGEKGKDNGVTVNFGNLGSDGGGAQTLTTNGRTNVTFNINPDSTALLSRSEMTFRTALGARQFDMFKMQLDHEGVHVADDRSGRDVSRLVSEYKAYTVTSYVMQAFGRNVSFDTSTFGRVQIWNRSWASQDIETMRSHAAMKMAIQSVVNASAQRK